MPEPSTTDVLGIRVVDLGPYAMCNASSVGSRAYVDRRPPIGTR